MSNSLESKAVPNALEQIDKVGDSIRSCRFIVKYMACNPIKPWNYENLNFLTSDVKFEGNDLLITFTDTDKFAMYRYPSLIGGLVTVDIMVVDWQYANEIDTMRYNCHVCSGEFPQRSTLSYSHDSKETINKTTIRLHVLEYDLASKLEPVTLKESNEVDADPDSRFDLKYARRIYNNSRDKMFAEKHRKLEEAGAFKK